MLLLLFAGAKATTVTGCSFQANAFQSNAFQPCPGPAPPPAKKIVGWARFTHTVEELEERLRLQRQSTPQWFYKFAKAHKAALDRAAKAKTDRQRAALEEAADAAALAAFEVVAEYRESADEVFEELLRAAGATRVTASIKHCEEVIELMLETDETEAELMILLH